jgi:hypothetical protein
MRELSATTEVFSLPRAPPRLIGSRPAQECIYKTESKGETKKNILGGYDHEVCHDFFAGNEPMPGWL